MYKIIFYKYYDYVIILYIFCSLFLFLNILNNKVKPARHLIQAQDKTSKSFLIKIF